MYRLAPGLELILASASPRRRELLAQVGLEFRVEPSAAPEELLPGEDAAAAAVRLAAEKARWVAREVAARYPAEGRVILAADTLVEAGGEIMGKPRDGAQAREMLGRLSGAWHRVVTGFHLIHAGGETGEVVATRVRFRRLLPGEITAYLASGEPMGKAGAYAVQGKGAALVAEVAGSYANVVGLPLARVVEILLTLGLARPAREG
ncbi:MAG: septum formation protein Maf [Deltaproteobacteria bacterium]|nr:septum formation protein Maf [Deltaproteobacteria bacterium]